MCPLRMALGPLIPWHFPLTGPGAQGIDGQVAHALAEPGPGIVDGIGTLAMPDLQEALLQYVRGPLLVLEQAIEHAVQRLARQLVEGFKRSLVPEPAACQQVGELLAVDVHSDLIAGRGARHSSRHRRCSGRGPNP
ncbi:hypothetical protein D3C72_2007070 [compost metagenome]